jgi:8-oxo-dGTP pyrophosphatase MutT (NUDIX family)
VLVSLNFRYFFSEFQSADTFCAGESPEDGAVRETLEEAGVIGEVLEKIGVFVDGKKNRTHYYALLVSVHI